MGLPTIRMSQTVRRPPTALDTGIGEKRALGSIWCSGVARAMECEGSVLHPQIRREPRCREEVVQLQVPA